MSDKFAYHQHLAHIAMADVDLVIAKDRSYGASWKKRGGTGAFMMLARKWDRLEEMLQKPNRYDIFEAIQYFNIGQKGSPFKQGDDGTVLAEIRDLRRYLLLVEAEMMEQGAVAAPVKPVQDSSIMWFSSLEAYYEHNPKAKEDGYVPPQFANNQSQAPTKGTPTTGMPEWVKQAVGDHKPVPIEDSNRHADRAQPSLHLRQSATYFEWTQLTVAERDMYEWSGNEAVGYVLRGSGRAA